MKRKIRFVALLLAALMIITAMAGLLATVVRAATDTKIITDSVVVLKAGTNTKIDRVMKDKTLYSLRFQYTEANSSFPIGTTKQPINVDRITVSPSCMLYTTSKSTAKIDVTVDDEKNATITMTIHNVRYREDGTSLDITAEIDNVTIGSAGVFNYSFDYSGLTIPTEYYTGSSDSGTIDPGITDPGTDDGIDDPVVTATSQIVVENCIALDSAGNRIDEITKDTPSFTLEIVFADIGLHDFETRDIRNADLQTYITNAGGFRLNSSAKGKAVLATQGVDYPRFRATFSNVSWEGADKTIGFTVFYQLDDVEGAVKGEGVATLFAAKLDEEDEEDENKMGVAVPRIIVSSYSYGDSAIEAGHEFTLNFSIQNTSVETPLENVVVTLTPAANEAAEKGPGLIVASSSNTIYIPSMAAGETQSYSIDFQARPAAEATSHLINIKSTYEYIDTDKKERLQVPDFSESIAIPVTQVDRFTLEPVLEPGYGMVGEEGYITVNFINKGKSSISNISASVKIDPSVTAPSQNFDGQLDPSSSGTLDMYLTGSEPGEFQGEVTIQYEDENGEQKETATTFTFTVEEPYYPPMEPPPDNQNMEDMPAAGPGPVSIVLFVLGGIAIAVPISLYLMKRVKAKASEDFDEVF